MTASGLGIDALVSHLLVATQHAALASASWVGRGDRKAADAAAVPAMRAALDQVPGRGTVVIGEGEKDGAAMLYAEEIVGAGGPLVFDLAVDPLENTTACARGAEGAVSVIAAAGRATLWDTPAWYMDKLIVGREVAGSIDIERPLEENLDAVAKGTGKRVEDLVAVVLDKPRHTDLIARLHRAGARVSRIPDGDVLGALRVLLPDGDADVLLGVGGAPEGVINACSARLLGGEMQARLAPQSGEERERVVRAGQDPRAVLALDELVTTDDCAVVVTGVTSGTLLRGPYRSPTGVRTQSFVLSRLHPGLLVESMHVDGDSAGDPVTGSLAHA